MKHSFLVLGILMMSIFINRHKDKIFSSRREKIIPYPCRSALVMLERRAEKNWSLECEKNALKINIKEDFTGFKLVEVKTLSYRKLANAYSFVSKNSLNESLAKTETVSITLESPQFSIRSWGSGQHVASMVHMNQQSSIAKHLENFIKVKEIPEE